MKGNLNLGALPFLTLALGLTAAKLFDDVPVEHVNSRHLAACRDRQTFFNTNRPGPIINRPFAFEPPERTTVTYFVDSMRFLKFSSSFGS